MKRLFTFVLLFTTVICSAQEAWTRLNDFTAGDHPRQGGVSFSINGLGYFGTGADNQGAYYKDFWRYDPATDTWAQMQDVGGVGRYMGVGFAIGNKGYLGTGNIANSQTLIGANDFYEYDPATNVWTIKQNVGYTGRISAVAFTVGGKGYVTTGFNGTNFANYDNTTWEFDPSTNTWTQKSDFAGDPRDGAASFAANGIGYVFAGENANANAEYGPYGPVIFKTNWAFDPSTNVWTLKNLLPTSFYSSIGFSIGSNNYLVGTPQGSYSRTWLYNPSNDSWTAKLTYPYTFLYGSSFVICTQAFIVGDNNSGRVYKYSETVPVISGISTVCTSASYSVSQGVNSWSSSNTGILTINSAGVATRVGSASGPVTITAILCSGPITKNIWVGIPTQPGPVSGPTAPGVGSFIVYISSASAQGNVDSHGWILPYGGKPKWIISGGGNSLQVQTIVGASSGLVQVYGHNLCGNGGVSFLQVNPVGGGGGGGGCNPCQRMASDEDPEVETFERIAFYPNPANAELKVRLMKPASQDGELSFMDLFGNVKRSGVIKQGTQYVTIETRDMFPGVYLVKINDGSNEYYSKVLVQH